MEGWFTKLYRSIIKLSINVLTVYDINRSLITGVAKLCSVRRERKVG